MPLEIERALRELVCEPGGRHEIGDERVSDEVSVLIILNGIADLARPERPLRILIGRN